MSLRGNPAPSSPGELDDTSGNLMQIIRYHILSNSQQIEF